MPLVLLTTTTGMTEWKIILILIAYAAYQVKSVQVIDINMIFYVVILIFVDS